MYFVYILQSIKDKKYYIGQTENVDDRLAIHNKGLVRSTRLRIPFIIVKTETFDTDLTTFMEKQVFSIEEAEYFLFNVKRSYFFLYDYA